MHSLPILLILTIHITTGQWIDPHSMDSNLKSKLPNRSQKTPEKESENILLQQNECDSDIHLRRVVRLILNNAYLDSDMDYFEGYINVKLTSLEHQFLTKFAQSMDIRVKSFNDISSILEHALQKPTIEKYHEIVLSLEEKLYELVFNPTSAALTAACVVLYVLYRLVVAEFTWKSIIKYFLFFCYVLDFVITYLHIIRDTEIDNMVNIKTMGGIPPECNPEKMSWWNYAKTRFESTFFENPCKIYYQSTFENYRYIIAPSKVFVRQFKTFMEPFGDIGEAFGKFGRGMFTSLPWGLNVALFPIMLIVSIVFVFLGFLFVTKPHFKLGLFHLFSIEMGRPAQLEPAPITTNRTNQREIEYEQNRALRRRRNRNNGREVGFVKNHRELVEDVSNSSRGSGQTEVKKVLDGQGDGNTEKCDRGTNKRKGGDGDTSKSKPLVVLSSDCLYND